jgi:alkaline phosphatase D
MRCRYLILALVCYGASLLTACKLNYLATATPPLLPTASMTHGPLVGAVTANTAQVWVRTNEPARVKVEYTPNSVPGAEAFSSEFVSEANSDFTLRIPLATLTPATAYDVNVWVDGRKQAQGGQFKTFPAETEAAPLKLVILTDFGYGDTPPDSSDHVTLRTFEAADAEQPDFVFIGGDFDHRDPKLIPDKRQMFKDLYADDPKSPVFEFTKHILHRYPLAHQWDDHDYGGDNSDRMAAWRETARQVFEEYFPAYPTGKYGIYQSFHFGREVEIFVLDGRSQRDPNQAPDSADKSMLNGEHHADGQWQWLLEGLENSTAKWKLIMTPSAMNDTLLKGDSWARFSHEREALLQFIRDNKIGGVIFIAGDLHGGALDDGHNAGAPSVVVPSANLFKCLTVPELKLGDWSNGVYGDAAHIANSIPCPGYGLISIQGAHAVIEIKDSDGNVKLRMELTPQDSYVSKP